jgi:glycosyltransferase involved in cell wall biosynthesis
MKLSIISPYPPTKGGISKETEVLHKILKNDFDIKILTFNKLYPDFLYPSNNQGDITLTNNYPDVSRCINSLNIKTWNKTVKLILENKTTHLLFRYWTPLFIPMYLFIIRRIKSRSKKMRILCICDNIYPHERILFDKMLINYFFKHIDRFMVMSNKSKQQLNNIINGNGSGNDKVIQSFLPLKSLRDNKVSQTLALKKLDIKKPKLLLLFFGFIRDYKGLDILLEALNHVSELDIKLLIAGECYTKNDRYKNMIEKYELHNMIIWHNSYIPEDSIKYYFSACDVVVLPHRKISQSGIIPIAYEFNKLVVCSDIPSFKENIVDKKTGYLFEKNNSLCLSNKIKYIYSNHNFKNSSKYISVYKSKYSNENIINDFKNLLNI